MCASDRCFNKGRLAAAFCRAGKVWDRPAFPRPSICPPVDRADIRSGSLPLTSHVVAVVSRQVLKTERGVGLEQPAMWAAEERLAAGEWLHIFPEGTRSKDGRTLGRVR